MFVLSAIKNKLVVKQKEAVTSGSVNVYTARFEFDKDWDGLTTKAVFRGSGKIISVLLDENGECIVPWEVLKNHGGQLSAGVYGTKDDTVLPTIWANLGYIFEGVTEGDNEQPPPSPDVWEQLVQQSQEAVDIARKLRDDAEAGAFIGPEGPKGNPGDPGSDGFSPEIITTSITGGTQVIITSAAGPSTFNVMDGLPGPAGPKGEQGERGEGVPDGGTPGQVLTKTVGGTAWETPSGGGSFYEFGHGLKQEGLTVSVDMASSNNPDKSLPISAAAVDTTVGNIEILLKTI